MRACWHSLKNSRIDLFQINVDRIACERRFSMCTVNNLCIQLSFANQLTDIDSIFDFFFFLLRCVFGPIGDKLDVGHCALEVQSLKIKLFDCMR